MDGNGKFAFDCPSCNRRLVAKNRHIGSKKPCPNCQAVIEIPGIFVPDRNDLSPDATRQLAYLSFNAAKLIQHIIETDFDAAVLVNTVFLYLPKPDDLQIVFTLAPRYAVQTWRICKDAHKTIARYGIQHKFYWIEEYCAKEIHNPRSAQIQRNYSQARKRWPPSIRIAVWERYNRTCYLCGVQIETWQGEYMHLDHAVALANGGTDDEDNLLPACPICNLQKGARVFAELKIPTPNNYKTV